MTHVLKKLEFPYDRVWCSDSKTLQCNDCKTEFRIFLGRHHCRVCGKIFCKWCLQSLPIPTPWVLERDCNIASMNINTNTGTIGTTSSTPTITSSSSSSSSSWSWFPYEWVSGQPETKKHLICKECQVFHTQVFAISNQIQMKQCFILLHFVNASWFFHVSSSSSSSFLPWFGWMVVSKTWYRCFHATLVQLRLLNDSKHQIPYHLIDVHSDLPSIIWNFRDVLLRHSHFLMYFLVHVKKEEKQKIRYLMTKLKSKKHQIHWDDNHSNDHSLAFRQYFTPCEAWCSPRFTSHQFIEYLSLYKKNLIPELIRKWISSSLAFTVSQFRTFFPILIEYYVEERDAVLLDFFQKQLQKNPSLVIEFYWWLQTHIGASGKCQPGTSAMSLWWNPIAESLDADSRKKLSIHITFIQQMFQVISTNLNLQITGQQSIGKVLFTRIGFLRNSLLQQQQQQQLLKQQDLHLCSDCTHCDPHPDDDHELWMPSQTNLLRIVSWIPENCTIINSKTRPLLLTLINHQMNASMDTTTTNGYIFKSDDVCRDAILLGIIQLMDDILREDLGINFEAVKYTVIPIDRGKGFVEIVPRAKTLFEIKYILRQSLLVWLSNHNQEEKLSHLCKKFTRSCAFYYLVGYLFAIGDRHSRNILITEQGQLFHIDFGFILGENAGPLSNPRIQISKEMRDCMGGKDPVSAYQEFCHLCNKMYQCLRRHMNLFLSLLQYLTRQKLIPMTCDVLTQELGQRFQRRFASESLDTNSVFIWDGLSKMTSKIADLSHFYLPKNLSSTFWPMKKKKNYEISKMTNTTTITTTYDSSSSSLSSSSSSSFPWTFGLSLFATTPPKSAPPLSISVSPPLAFAIPKMCYVCRKEIDDEQVVLENVPNLPLQTSRNESRFILLKKDDLFKDIEDEEDEEDEEEEELGEIPRSLPIRIPIPGASLHNNNH